jgi:signal transduction histidine kinase
VVKVRVWDLVVAAAVVLVAALVAVTATAGPWMMPAALGLLAAFALFYGFVGRRGLDGGRWALPLAAALIVTTAVGTGLSPNMATLQCVAYPLLWWLLPSERLGRPIAACVVLAVGTAAGFVVSFGGGIDALMQAVVIQGVSLALGVGLGVWFTVEMRKGAENTRLLAELTAAQDQLAALHREAGAGAERERIARDLHDTIAQNLTSIVMLAQRAQNAQRTLGTLGAQSIPGAQSTPGARGAAGLDPADEPATADLVLIEEVAREALNETRALVAASAPVAVEGGLVTALGRLVGTFERETRIGISTRFDEIGPLPRELEVVLLRCAQEALANVRKHAAAQHARLTLVRTDAPGGQVTLTVRDDGVGLGGGAQPGSGFGLEGMRQRLALAGGSLTVSEVTGGGTELVAALPAAPRRPGDTVAVGEEEVRRD